MKRCLAENAEGYLSKRLGVADLMAALERVHAGESVVADGLLGDSGDPDWVDPDWPATRRADRA